MLITIPNKMLNTKCQNIDQLEFDSVFGDLEKEIQQHKTAVGLAAPQIGVLKRAFIIRQDGQIYRFANSTIEGGRYPDYVVEQCLSIPNRDFRVQRYRRITIKDDINGEKEYRKFFAQIVQHEHDHTEGITLLEKGHEVNIHI